MKGNQDYFGVLEYLFGIDGGGGGSLPNNNENTDNNNTIMYN
jgi:hypothetical protein